MPYLQSYRSALLDDGVRDLSFIRETNFPVFTSYLMPADVELRWEINE
jgi:regulator of RNase E activity RraA